MSQHGLGNCQQIPSLYLRFLLPLPQSSNEHTPHLNTRPTRPSMNERSKFTDPATACLRPKKTRYLEAYLPCFDNNTCHLTIGSSPITRQCHNSLHQTLPKTSQLLRIFRFRSTVTKSVFEVHISYGTIEVRIDGMWMKISTWLCSLIIHPEGTPYDNVGENGFERQNKIASRSASWIQHFELRQNVLQHVLGPDIYPGLWKINPQLPKKKKTMRAECVSKSQLIPFRSVEG